MNMNQIHPEKIIIHSDQEKNVTEKQVWFYFQCPTKAPAALDMSAFVFVQISPKLFHSWMFTSNIYLVKIFHS